LWKVSINHKWLLLLSETKLVSELFICGTGRLYKEILVACIFTCYALIGTRIFFFFFFFFGLRVEAFFGMCLCGCSLERRAQKKRIAPYHAIWISTAVGSTISPKIEKRARDKSWMKHSPQSHNSSVYSHRTPSVPGKQQSKMGSREAICLPQELKNMCKII
jgi:hypothetical protein